MTKQRTSFGAFWRAEVIRQQEAAQGPFAEPAVPTAPSLTGRAMQTQALQRAERLIERQQLEPTLHRFQFIARLGLAMLVLFAMLSGVGLAMQITPAQERTVSLIEALLLLIVLNAVFIMIWCLSIAAKPRARGLAGWLMHGFTGRMQRHETIRIATAHSSVLHRHRLIQPTFSCISHLLWVVLLGAAMLALTARFVAFEYEFVWRTTLLSAAQIETLLTFFHSLPGQFGLTRPDLSPPTGTEQANRDIALWLLTSIGIYALMPRLVLLAICNAVRRYRLNRLRIDWSLPGWSELRQQWQQHASSDIDPAPVHIQRHGPNSPRTSSAPHGQATTKTATTSAVAPMLAKVVATVDWSEQEHALLQQQLSTNPQLSVLSANSAAQRQQLLHGVKDKGGQRAILLLVNTQVSPDRGTLRFIDTLQQCAQVSIALVANQHAEKHEVWRSYITQHLAQADVVNASADQHDTSLVESAALLTDTWLHRSEGGNC